MASSEPGPSSRPLYGGPPAMARWQNACQIRFRATRPSGSYLKARRAHRLGLELRVGLVILGREKNPQAPVRVQRRMPGRPQLHKFTPPPGMSVKAYDVCRVLCTPMTVFSYPSIG